MHPPPLVSGFWGHLSRRMGEPGEVPGDHWTENRRISFSISAAVVSGIVGA